MSVRVACCQAELAVGEIERNRAVLERMVREAAAEGARIVVMPELACSGYVFADAGEARRLAEPLDGPTVTAWSALAAELDAVLVGGLCEDSGGVLHNSAVLIDPSGLRAVYRKVHLWDREPDVFAPGAEPPPVVDTALGRVAIMVCYDLEFPEWVRRPALGGAALLCAPVNWPASPRPQGERAGEVIRVQGDASVNRMFVAACDRVGAERGVDWVGGSVIAGPDGFPLAGPLSSPHSGVIAADCRLDDAHDKAVGPRNDVHADRRPELYA